MEILLVDVKMKEDILLLCEIENSVFVDILGEEKSRVCSMIAGYLNGWFKTAMERKKLDTREIVCKAAGDDTCRFVTGKIGRITELVRREDLKKSSNEYPVIKFE